MGNEVKWTFITDALPENEYAKYFVTTSAGNVTVAGWTPYEYEGRVYGGIWTDCFCYDDNYDEIEVVAWMPFTLPAPYKPEKEEANEGLCD